MNKDTQGIQLVRALRKKPMTYGDMQRLGISTSPQKRVSEALKLHFPSCELVKSKTRDGLVTWRVVGPTRFTA